MAGSSAQNGWADCAPIPCPEPSGAAAASPAAGVVTERTSAIAFSRAFLIGNWGDWSSAVPSRMLL
eukprot:3434260-Pyramimonas_sp.AAC.1